MALWMNIQFRTYGYTVGIDRYLQTTDRSVGERFGSKTKHGRQIIKGILDSVQMAIDEHCAVNQRRNKSISKNLPRLWTQVAR